MLSSCCTTDMVPVDLNAFLYDMERNLADFAVALGHTDDEIRFRAAAAARAAAIMQLMYCPGEGNTCASIYSRRITRAIDQTTSRFFMTVKELPLRDW